MISRYSSWRRELYKLSTEAAPDSIEAVERLESRKSYGHRAAMGALAGAALTHIPFPKRSPPAVRVVGAVAGAGIGMADKALDDWIKTRRATIESKKLATAVPLGLPGASKATVNRLPAMADPPPASVVPRIKQAVNYAGAVSSIGGKALSALGRTPSAAKASASGVAGVGARPMYTPPKTIIPKPHQSIAAPLAPPAIVGKPLPTAPSPQMPMANGPLTGGTRPQLPRPGLNTPRNVPGIASGGPVPT